MMRIYKGESNGKDTGNPRFVQRAPGMIYGLLMNNDKEHRNGYSMLEYKKGVLWGYIGI